MTVKEILLEAPEIAPDGDGVCAGSEFVLQARVKAKRKADMCLVFIVFCV